LCTASNCAVFRFDGELIHVVALQNVNPEGTESVRQAYPVPPRRGNATARAILTRDVVDIPDVCEDAEYQLQGMAATVGFRSVLAVPMLREGNPIGAISVTGADVAAFSDNQVELLKTFADQAVIAIENVRLFTELQASNRDLTTALDTQTATSDILRVISRSQTDVQPVFQTIMDSAVRLLRGYSGLVTRIAGDQIVLAALTLAMLPRGRSSHSRTNPPGRTPRPCAIERRSISPTPRPIRECPKPCVPTPAPVATEAGLLCRCSVTTRPSGPLR